MDTISGFWAGAMAFEPRRLHAWAEAAGGWAVLARSSLADRVALGVPADAARRWVDTPPLHTLGRAVVYGSADYPPQLGQEGSAPPVLLVEGSVEVLHEPSVAIVGTRRCTPYGASVAHRAAQASVAGGSTVTSGLARGIDTHAHRGCLAAGGRTIAVLGHGLSFTSPTANAGLRADIVRQGGAIISTFPDHEEASTHTFPIRNEWIAGLSRLTVMIEAPASSGARLTARAALRRSRPVLIAPGPLGAPTWAGSAEMLLRDTEGVRPLLDLSQLAEHAARNPVPANQRWIEDLVAGVDVEPLARELGMSTLDLLRRISELEVSGRLVRLPGGWGRGAAVP